MLFFRSRRTLVSLFPLLPLGSAHMSIWHPSMYGVGAGFSYDAGDPVAPLGPGVQDMKDWWFRGPQARALKPQNGSVMELPAGGTAEVEIACNVARTSYGSRTTDPSAPLSACPDNYGAYHAGNPAGPLDDGLLSGCALAVAHKDDIDEVGWDDLVVFSTKRSCVRERVTSFEVPRRMPSCPGGKCICAWLWLANNGTANFYMTGFDCTFTNVDPTVSRPLLSPVDPVFCPAGNTTCIPARGAKRPLFAYNSPTNVVWEGNDARPGYHASWSFTVDGAQEDIFQEDAAESSRSPSSISTLSSVSADTGTLALSEGSRVSKATSPTLFASAASSRPVPHSTNSPTLQRPSSTASPPTAYETGVARIVDDLAQLLDGVAAEKRDLTYSVEELRALGQADEQANEATIRSTGRELVFALVLAALVLL